MVDVSTSGPPTAPGREVDVLSVASPGRRHLHDVDVVRLTTVVGVLCVHATSLMLPTDEVSGAALSVLHATREVFLFLSAFVLAYSSRTPIVVRSFWRKRMPLVLAPYVVWSAIYVVADGDLGQPFTVFARFCRDLLSGAAHFHLYFLLLTLQLYVIFPWLRQWLGRRRHHGWILVAAIAWQLAFTSAIYFHLQLPGILGTWLTHPGTWLWSYVLYVIGGILAALHFDAVRDWTSRHARAISVTFLAALVVVIGGYEADVHVLGESFLHAGEVFAPGVVVGSCAAIMAQFALGLRVAARARPRTRRLLETSSDLSFGVYLAHPLLYMVLLDALAAFGQQGLTGLPAGVGLALVVLVIAPATYLITSVAVWLVRRTPISLVLTGRRRRVAAPRPTPTPA